MASLTVYSQPVNQVFEEWVTSDGTQNYFIKAAVETDADGFVYVAGATLNNAGNYDLLVSKYDDEGNVLWTDQYNGTGNGNDAATALVVDASGNVYVTGSTYSGSTDTLDVITIAYDDTGSRDWLEVYAGAGQLADFGTCIALSGSSVYVGGSATHASKGLDFLALKYNTSGVLQWDTQKDYNSLTDVCTKLTLGDANVFLAGATNTTGFDWDMLTMNFAMSDGSFVDDATASGGSVGFAHVRAMDRDLDGNIYLTGTVANMSTGYDIHTVKIDTFMNVLWDVDYSSSGNHDDEGNALAIDPSNGNVYVGGFKDVSGQGTDFVTLMYDDAGSLQWSAMWNDSADGGDTIKALVVDANGNVTVTGSAWNGSSLDYHTIQYDDTGTLLWERSYNDKYNFTDAPMDIATTNDGGIVVTGQSLNPDSTWSYVTVKYLEHAFVLPVDSDSVSTSLRWLANRDQLLDTDTNLVDRVKYYSNQCYPNLYFMEDTLSYVFFQGVDTTNNDTLHRIDMTFNAASADQSLLPMDKESYWNNYYLGHIPEGRPFVSLYDRLVKQDVWPHIDVVYSSNQRGLKYYFVVHPSGETGAIALDYHGYDDLYVDGNDALLIESSIGELVQPQALAYEMDGNGELTLLNWQPDYDVTGGQVTFDGLGSWSGDLVIEVNWGYVNSRTASNGNVKWSTFFGATSDDWILDMTKSPQDELFAGGKTFSTDFSAVLGAAFVANSPLGGQDGMIAKFDQYDVLKWLTYVGGSGHDAIQSLTFNDVAGTNKLFFVGYLESSDFQVAPGANPGGGTYYKGSSSGGRDALIGRLHENLGSLQFGAYLGGSNADEAKSVVCDTDGNIYITGITKSNTAQANSCLASTGTQFPLCNPGNNAYYQNTNHGAQDIFLVKLDQNNTLIWSTFFGSDAEDVVYEINLATDPAANFNPNAPTILICGNTLKQSSSSNACSGAVPSTEFPLCDPGSPSYFQAGSGAFISRFSLEGVLLWSSNFNNITSFQTITSSDDYFYAVGLKRFAGTPEPSTCSPQTGYDVPICSGNGGYNSNTDDVELYIVKMDKAGNSLYWSTLYGNYAEIDFNSNYIFQQPAAPHVYEKYLDAVASNDDYLFVLGASTMDFDCHLDPNFASWYYQSANYSYNYGTTGEITSDAFILGFDASQERKWSTLFGAGHNFAYLNFPMLAEFGSCSMLKGNNLFIAGYSGTDAYAPNHPFPFEDEGVQPTGNAYFSDGSTTNFQDYDYDGFIAKFDITQMLVGVEEPASIKDGMLLFPNPSHHSFDLVLPDGVSNCMVRVIDLAGREVLPRQEYVSGSGSINISHLPVGMYIVEVSMKSKVGSTKMIKQ